MTKSPLLTIRYQDNNRQVSWCGVKMEEGKGFNALMSGNVASRVNDTKGRDEFNACLRGLANTGFARESLDAILEAEVPEERDWAVGEAMAETYLTCEYEIHWPWNLERDKRNPRASLPGADLVGFRIAGEDVRLALGEVKTSTDVRTPPGVMSGRSGMKHQIDNLAKDLSLIRQLLYWLLFRCKGTVYEASFNAAVALFLESGNKAVSLFGVLIRDTRPHVLDLQARARTLAGSLEVPTTCHLTAIYIPCAIADLPARAEGGVS